MTEIPGQVPTPATPPVGVPPTPTPIVPPAGTPPASVPPATATPPAPEPAEEPQTYSKEYVQRLRSEAANYRTKAAALEDAENKRKLAEMSEADRLKAQLAEAEARAKTLEVKTLRIEALAKHGLTPEDIQFLTGEEASVIDTQAEKLAARLKAAAPAAATPGTALPPSGQRSPAGGSANVERVQQEAIFTDLQSRIPALRGRKIA
jgi:hypothetical protein